MLPLRWNAYVKASCSAAALATLRCCQVRATTRTTSLHLGNIVIRDDTTLAALGRELIAVNVPSCVCSTEDGREAEETQSRAPSPCVAPAASAAATASPLPTTATRTNNFVKVLDTSAVQAEKSAMVVSASRVSHERNFHESLRGSGYVIVE